MAFFSLLVFILISNIYSYSMDDNSSTQFVETDSRDQANLRDSEFVWEPRGSELQAQHQQQGTDTVNTSVNDIYHQSWSGDGSILLRQSLDGFRRDSLREGNWGEPFNYSSNFGFLHGSNNSYLHATDRRVNI